MSFLGDIWSGAGDMIGDVVGGITGSNKAAELQERANEQQIAEIKRQDIQNRKDFDPYRKLGITGISQINQFQDPNYMANLMKSYYGSDQYKQDLSQASNAQAAMREATGGLGGSAFQNSLAAIAPQLGRQYAQDEYTRRYGQTMDLINTGQSAAARSAASGTNASNTIANLYGERGAIQAGAKLAPFKDLMGIAKTGASLMGGGF